jgi:hypothetical protein
VLHLGIVSHLSWLQSFRSVAFCSGIQMLG